MVKVETTTFIDYIVVTSNELVGLYSAIKVARKAGFQEEGMRNVIKLKAKEIYYQSMVKQLK